ncbi:MAG: PIG-L family deacetylase [Chloroflexi bacterium]|nr:PIG-L family deacetylase [Chloroflexota bacterium]
MIQEPQQQEEPYRRAMVVVAHADDAEFGCSGTVARWCRQGMEVVYVLVTDGSKGTGDRGLTPERLAEIRREEQIAAGKILGLKEVVFLNYPDAYLQPTLEVRRSITREIRRHRPDILITLNPTRTLSGNGYIGHPDHFAAGEAALSAVFPAARDHLTFPDLLREGLEPHKVREVLIIGHDHPDKWIDVTDTMEVATQALLAHASQIGPEAAERIKEWRRQAGREVGVAYAEAFKQFILR